MHGSKAHKNQRSKKYRANSQQVPKQGNDLRRNLISNNYCCLPCEKQNQETMHDLMHTKKVDKECECDKHSHDANDNINKMENISNKKKFQQENGCGERQKAQKKWKANYQRWQRPKEKNHQTFKK